MKIEEFLLDFKSSFAQRNSWSTSLYLEKNIGVKIYLAFVSTILLCPVRRSLAPTFFTKAEIIQNTVLIMIRLIVSLYQENKFLYKIFSVVASKVFSCFAL